MPKREKRSGRSTPEPKTDTGDVDLRQEHPFGDRIPNATTRRALWDSEARRFLVGYDGADELFEDLGI